MMMAYSLVDEGNFKFLFYFGHKMNLSFPACLVCTSKLQLYHCPALTMHYIGKCMLKCLASILLAQALKHPIVITSEKWCTYLGLASKSRMFPEFQGPPNKKDIFTVSVFFLLL